jgi:hypothetical protein
MMHAARRGAWAAKRQREDSEGRNGPLAYLAYNTQPRRLTPAAARPEAETMRFAQPFHRRSPRTATA